jgi:predicted peptidase
MAPVLAAAKTPMWVFAGGRDAIVPLRYFYPLLNRLEELGHPDVRFTIEADMGHPTWVRVYASQDFYSWLLSHSK